MDFAIKNTNWKVLSLVLFTQLANAKNVTYLYIKKRANFGHLRLLEIKPRIHI